MRIAFFSPLPPAKSGIADYSAALLGEMKQLANVETFTERPGHLRPGVLRHLPLPDRQQSVAHRALRDGTGNSGCGGDA